MPPIDNAIILEPIKKIPLDFPVILAIFFFSIQYIKRVLILLEIK